MTGEKDSNPHTSELFQLGEMALSALVGACRDLHDRKTDLGEMAARKLDLVTREEFDALMSMTKKIRATQDALEKRLAALEKESK